MNNKIRVLIVDDSLISREIISMGISSSQNIEVVAKAGDPFEAADQILKFKPDVMTCDIEMPKMNGIEFIRKLLPQYSIPVIVVSSINEAVFDAINAGAVDFVSKPDAQSPSSVENFIKELIKKIKIAAVSHIIDKNKLKTNSLYGKDSINTDAIIAIGASTGGTEAIYNLLSVFPHNMPGIVITQHIPPGFSTMFASRLNNQTKLNVKEAESGDIIEKGKVLIAPGSKHMVIKKKLGKYYTEVFEGERVNGHCPSVDVLFESVAKEAKDKAIGIILTGMGYDGAKGLLAMKRKGAKTIGQDEKSSVIYGMPKVAYDIGAVERQASLSNIPQVLISILRSSV
ncbi:MULTISPECIES: protein-glutamate methylesterase/protein-glutamine glutaminase [Clostridium]|uniref:protein-glutamate methylesterase/protein-glutamine glutaminase n=1 Tax=Clostridium TaxID=1485 RepID=UPI0008241D28|nr:MULTISPECIES: chemotaxis response regulator protein-glutamate methylesterase [Clostridium]PJI08208.1 chemotaxis response regulator protein-glutamate methylesterase [Clostridium sp. CT7]